MANNTRHSLYLNDVEGSPKELENSAFEAPLHTQAGIKNKKSDWFAPNPSLEVIINVLEGGKRVNILKTISEGGQATLKPNCKCDLKYRCSDESWKISLTTLNPPSKNIRKFHLKKLSKWDFFFRIFSIRLTKEIIFSKKKISGLMGQYEIL